MAEARRLKPDQIAEIFRRFQQGRSRAQGRARIVNPYTLLVAVVLSAQATDAGVNRATGRCSRSPTRPKRCWRSARRSSRDYISSIGLYRDKAKNVIGLSKALIEKHGGEVPRERDSARSAAGRRPQDRQCRAQHRLRRADHRRRHAYLPGRQPHRPGAGQDAVRGRD